MGGGWTSRADTLAWFPLKSQKRYHEDIFGAVFPYEVKKDGAARQPSDPRVPAAHGTS